MEKEQIKSVVECLLFVTNRPLTPAELSDITGETAEDIQVLVEELKTEMAARKSALRIEDIAEGWQLAAKEGFSYWVKKLFREQTTFRLSPSALETLSIIAYKQPLTRAEIEEIRGVEVVGVLETLIERKLAKVAGRKETVGRPLLYATTPEFLRHFHLWKISDLPSLEDLAREAERKMGNKEQGPALDPTEPAPAAPEGENEGTEPAAPEEPGQENV